MINRYFESTIRIMIDEMNLLLEHKTDEERIIYAQKYSETDLVVRLGFPFRWNGHYPIIGSKGSDIIIQHRDMIVEVKYWRNWPNKKNRLKHNWDQSYGKAFTWLAEEIKNGNKGKRAVIAGWFTFFPWSNLLQLGLDPGGDTRHGKTLVNPERLAMLPFLSCKTGFLGDVRTDYEKIAGMLKRSKIDWWLFGNSDDLFNVIMLY